MSDTRMDEETRDIALAIEVLLTRIRLDVDEAAMDRSRNAGDIVRDILSARTELQIAAGRITREPVGRALRNAIRLLGERLFEAGGLERMDAVLAVIEGEVDDPTWYAAMLDRLWDGIGRDGDNEGWAT